MRLLTFFHGGVEQVGVRRGSGVIPVGDLLPDMPARLIDILSQGRLDSLREPLETHSNDGIPVADIQYHTLIPRPGKVVCIGRNYAAHAAEGGAEVPTFPEVFMRGATSLIPHEGAIIRPRCSEMLDFEGEIALVIGKQCRHATDDNALDHVAGYSLFHDATIRNYQKFSSQWTVGKNFDGTGAFGPELVTADELPGGVVGLTLTTRLNGELMQEGHTDQLIFPVQKLITILSEAMTLEPGDVIVTGTPAGVGFARKPPIWLKAGDQVEIEVAEIGRLVNTVCDEQ